MPSTEEHLLFRFVQSKELKNVCFRKNIWDLNDIMSRCTKWVSKGKWFSTGYPTLVHEFQSFLRGERKICISNDETHGHTHQFIQAGQTTRCAMAWTWTSVPKTMSSHGDRRGQTADFRDSVEGTEWMYLLFKCGVKIKPCFEWVIWHWSTLCQL